jgi:hypothetical protein
VRAGEGHCWRAVRRCEVTTDALWSRQEIRTQSVQCAGQVDIWEAVEEALSVSPDDVPTGGDAGTELPCDGCGADIGEPCRWHCTSRPCACPDSGFLCVECAL